MVRPDRFGPAARRSGPGSTMSVTRASKAASAPRIDSAISAESATTTSRPVVASVSGTQVAEFGVVLDEEDPSGQGAVGRPPVVGSLGFGIGDHGPSGDGGDRFALSRPADMALSARIEQFLREPGGPAGRATDFPRQRSELRVRYPRPSRSL